MRAPTCQQENPTAADIIPTIVTFIVVIFGLYVLSSVYLLLNSHRDVVTGIDSNSVTTKDAGTMNVSNPELFDVGTTVLVGKSFVSNVSFGVFTGENTSRYTIVHSTGAN